MASPAEIAQILPETLPADFGEWDSENAQASTPVDSIKSESRAVAPKEGAPLEAAPRETTPKELASRNVEAERGNAAAPRQPATPIDRHTLMAPVPSNGRGLPLSASAAIDYPGGDAYFRRLRSLKTAVERMPAIPESPEETATKTAALREASAVEESPAGDSAEDSIRQMFLSAHVGTEEDKRLSRKWKTIIAVTASLILLVAIQLVRYGTVSKVKSIVEPPAAAASTYTGPDTSAIKPSPAMRPATEATTNQTTAQPTANAEQTATPTPAAPAPVQSQMMHDQLLAPTRIPQGARTAPTNDAPPPAAGFSGASMEALNGNGGMGSMFKGQGHSNPTVVAPKPISVSAGVAVGMLIHQTQPLYPSIAKSARVQGTVALQATINKAGNVENVHIVGGPAMLRQAAVDAVKTWRYKPYKLNNQPTEVETTINVVFTLGG